MQAGDAVGPRGCVALFGLPLLGPFLGDSEDRGLDVPRGAPIYGDRSLAVIGERDARAGEMQCEDQRLIRTAALAGQNGVEALEVSKLAEWIDDRRRPIQAADH